jgi:hypothetical protein
MFPLPSRAGNSPSLQDSYQIQQGESTFFNFPLLVQATTTTTNLVKGSGVGQRGGLAGFPLLFPWEHKGLSL